MNKLLTGIGIFVLGVAVVVVISIITAFPVKWLFNSCLVGTIDGVHAINFWKALGLSALFGILVSLSALFGILVKSGSSSVSKKD